MKERKGHGVLIVEDERIVALDIRDMLVDMGYDAYAIASSADEAIAQASERCPDVVLMDIRIKGKRDGIATAALLRERFDVPVVYLTAHADEATVSRATATAPYGYLLKPVTGDALRSAIEVAIYRNHMERRLRERERWFSTTLRSIADAVITTDIAGRVTFMNPMAETLTGSKSEDAIGRQAREIVHIVETSAASAATSTPLDAALRARKPLELREARLLNRATGAEALIADSSAPVMDAGQLLGAVMVFRDITEQEKQRQQVELSDRLASLGTLAAGVAHEVNNPLAVVSGNVYMTSRELAAMREGLDHGASLAEQRAHLDAVDSFLTDVTIATERIAGIVSDLRVFSRPAARAATGAIELAPAIEWALRTTAHELRQRARVVTELGPVPRVTADESQLGQVFINLLVNAAQAIQPGHADRNTISVTARTDAAGWAVIEIADTGSGMSHEVQKRIFEPFFTTKEVGGGTGLGLSICRGIVSSLGGRIELESEPGEGTCVRVALPPGAPEEPSSLPVAEAPKPALRGRILVIDDEPLVLKLLQRVLQDHDVTTTDSARNALAWIQEGRSFDLIICDLMMPTMTGIAFYEALLQRAPALAARVVFLTGGAITAQVDGFLRSVENVRIQKPFAVEELLTQVQALLARG